MRPAGLRVDVDTLRGTRDGVPRLLDTFARHGIQATFFFCVGPDNMGRHLWRLLRPTFLWKMLRTRAASLYGWDILLRGTFGPGPRIVQRCGGVLRAARDAGHEIGLHAWDHHTWQTMDLDDGARAADAVRRGFDALADALGEPPACFAAPAWRLSPAAAKALDAFPFAYRSDCRGESVFRPEGGATQIPVTLPTYDELAGRDGVTDANYNETLLSRFRPEGLNVLCIHAEAEGGAKADLFEAFLARTRDAGIAFAPLSRLLPSGPPPTGRLENAPWPGREGLLCRQAMPSAR